jgi:acyl-CoA synthetase (AMP-forming)/AMP-acid ligase II
MNREERAEATPPLSPLAGLTWAAAARPTRTAVVHGERTFTYAELDERCRRLAAALSIRGIGVGEIVAILAPNIPALLEAHFGVPAAGAALVTLNTRLHKEEIATILEHAKPRLVLVDAELTDAVSGLDWDTVTIGDGTGEDPYEEMLARVEPSPALGMPADEDQPLAINYTSGTTGVPKGAVYTHRGAALQAQGLIRALRLDEDSVHLWTLPMFHCNGWCLTWAVTAAAATHICIRRVVPDEVWNLLELESVTHYSGAPTVQLSLVNSPGARRLPRPVCVSTGGAPPSPTLIERMTAFNLHPLHLYGLTETYGPQTRCTPRKEWSGLSVEGRARMQARQGEVFLPGEEVRVVDGQGVEVHSDGETVGEVIARGNTVAAGYLHDPERTAEAFRGGWFHTGDLAVRHPDGYIELRDRTKDVIISGGENLSSIEIEQVLARHPGIVEAAVVPIPDERWGERPVAFVERREDQEVTEEELRALCRQSLAGFKCPDRFEFCVLPRTATGKVQKFKLKELGG